MVLQKHSISVCMATYNGEKFIKEQLSSILNQISECDEIIISDDCSNDNTIQIILSFKDDRIKLYQNKINVGVVKNFENSIKKASKNYIFLSDQDDIWKEMKVQKILTTFNENPDVTMVFSNAEYIDANGESNGENFFSANVSETSLFYHFVRPKFLGCTVAFRNKSISKLLPFPEKIPVHDWWIGMLHIYYGKVKYIPENLISYRRHDANVTSNTRNNLSIILKWRIIVLVNFIKTILK